MVKVVEVLTEVVLQSFHPYPGSFTPTHMCPVSSTAPLQSRIHYTPALKQTEYPTQVRMETLRAIHTDKNVFKELYKPSCLTSSTYM